MAIVNLKTIGVVEKSKKKKKVLKRLITKQDCAKGVQEIVKKKKTNEDTYVITFDVVP